MVDEKDDDRYFEYDDDDYMYDDDQEVDKSHKMFVECPHPNKVAPPAITVENQDPASTKFIWKIDNFLSMMDKEKHYSDVFFVGNYPWRVFMYPLGNRTDHLSMYLEVADWTTLQYGWSRSAQFTTCYLNSLLQTLYHIPYFRKAVYHMPTTESDMASGRSIPLALQTLFYNLQYNEGSVGTKELTESFGWNAHDSFMQRDVQELNRVLCEKLEDKMKGTLVEGTIQQLFEGHYMNYTECINVDYKSTRKESFYDLQLDVKGCKDVYASFDKYVEVERLEGDNKYHAGQPHGLQDAKKGVLFTDFPPVLQLQLKRYEYDVMRDTMVKINDRYEFPRQLDLDRECRKYLSPDADRSVRNLYTLHAVLVHSGGGNGGHYYAFIRPTLSEQWFKFNDERVTKEDINWALEEQCGGEGRYSNAYMLVYIRESDRDKIICNADVKDIAEPLRTRFPKEQVEKEDEEHKKKDELQGLKTLKVSFHHATKVNTDHLSIRLPKQSTVGDVINELKTKVELSHPNAELRFLEVFSQKISKILPPSEKIMHLNDQYWSGTLRAEEILEEEENLGPEDRLISVCHFTKDANGLKHFGEPFLLAVHEGETLDAVKMRIQKKLQVPDEEFVKWKFAYLSWMGRVEYLQDSDIDPNRFPRSNFGARERYLGLEHPSSMRFLHIRFHKLLRNQLSVITESDLRQCFPHQTLGE
ncbi:hypothetical protein MKW98_016065 [Papaver atlanticum]|uniref:ubiquitinyl hydrolase 1 n=1 Tax=Papaver atlanticum TaxID=357466 RepID=A0AAD4T5P2_9MAGN|nr:hypothetical protein MKW98_016065 [Papaver atlanticum]